MIQDKNGNQIKSMEDWAKLYAGGNKAKHWKTGRSAYSIADYVINHDGLEKLAHRGSEVLGENIAIETVTPELELTFDDYGQGRVHDLGIYGHTDSGKSLFIGVESKVDETFNQTIGESYLKAKAKQISGKSTKAPERIENLITIHFPEPKINLFDLRYQLLYATVGTLAADQDLSVMYIIVFKTNLYDDLKGLENLKDYLAFVNALNAEELPSSKPDSLVHKLIIDGQPLFSIYEQIILK